MDDAAPSPPALSRRDLLLGALALAATSCDTGRAAPPEPKAEERGRVVVKGRVTVDMHSHAGHVLRRQPPFAPVAAPMREGGMAAICLAMVADSPVTRVRPDGRIEAVRAPASGELYGWSRTAFARLHELVEREHLAVVTDAASLAAAPARGPPSSSPPRAPTSSTSRSSASPRRTSCTGFGISSSRITARTRSATSRPSRRCMAG
jgi:membrane dipeptidase